MISMHKPDGKGQAERSIFDVSLDLSNTTPRPQNPHTGFNFKTLCSTISFVPVRPCSPVACVKIDPVEGGRKGRDGHLYRGRHCAAAHRDAGLH